MKIKILKNIILFIIGFCFYITIETVYRGNSYILMGCCGGFAVVLLDKINNKISWNLDILIQGILGSLLITFFELVIGEISIHSNIIPKMWDYSNVPLNFDGVICLPFVVIWIVLSVFAIFVADAFNYYVLEELPVPYYKLFGKTVLVFKEKHCKLK